MFILNKAIGQCVFIPTSEAGKDFRSDAFCSLCVCEISLRECPNKSMELPSDMPDNVVLAGLNVPKSTPINECMSFR